MLRVENKTSRTVTVSYSPYRDKVTLKPGSVVDLDRVVQLKITPPCDVEDDEAGNITIIEALCQRCRSRIRLVGLSMCGKCREKMAADQRRRYRFRREHGLCVSAGCKEVSTGAVRCKRHGGR